MHNGGTLRYTGATAGTDPQRHLSTGTSSTLDVSNAATAFTITGGSVAESNGALAKQGPGTLI